jgi:hypothetical protein
MLNIHFFYTVLRKVVIMFYKNFLAKKITTRFSFALALALGIANCDSVKAMDDQDPLELGNPRVSQTAGPQDLQEETATKGWFTTTEEAMYNLDQSVAAYLPASYCEARLRWAKSFEKDVSYERLKKNCRNEATRLYERITNCFSGNGCKRNKTKKQIQ